MDKMTSRQVGALRREPTFVRMRKTASFGTLALITLVMLLASCRSHREIGHDQTNANEKKIRSTYAALLGVPENSIDNIRLYAFIDEWYGTPYKYAGKDKNGIDCSDFVARLYKDVFSRTIAPPASSMYETCHALPREKLEEGDLVFFKIGSDKVSHVGVYLQNGRFVHASTSKGVIINSLDESYYKKYFFKGGKLKQAS